MGGVAEMGKTLKDEKIFRLCDVKERAKNNAGFVRD